jgi:hypothetical protein
VVPETLGGIYDLDGHKRLGANMHIGDLVKWIDEDYVLGVVIDLWTNNDNLEVKVFFANNMFKASVGGDWLFAYDLEVIG